jgi:hypothetical protein
MLSSLSHSLSPPRLSLCISPTHHLQPWLYFAADLSHPHYSPSPSHLLCAAAAPSSPSPASSLVAVDPDWPSPPPAGMSPLGHYSASPDGGLDQGFLSRTVSIGAPVGPPAMHHRMVSSGATMGMMRLSSFPDEMELGTEFRHRW